MKAGVVERGVHELSRACTKRRGGEEKSEDE